MPGPTLLEMTGSATGAAVFAATAIGMAIWDKNRQIVGVNETFERDLGVDGGSIGLSMEAVVAAEVCGNFATVLDEVAQSEGSLVLELPCLRDGQTKVPFVVVVIGARAVSGGGICLFIDARSHGAWVAHEINNSLAYAMGNLSFAIESLEGLIQSLPQLTVVLLALRDALEGAERVRQTMRDLRTLPRQSNLESHEVLAPSLGTDARAVKRAKVLVVDDEPQMGTAIARILSPLHDVTAVYSARDAIAHLGKDEDFDIILCDIMMPQMSGHDLYRELLQTSPGLANRIVFMTGGPFSLRGATFLETVPNVQLEKPFSPAALRELVRKAVA
jgi:CheY-like chemotaxis protein